MISLGAISEVARVGGEVAMAMREYSFGTDLIQEGKSLFQAKLREPVPA